MRLNNMFYLDFYYYETGKCKKEFFYYLFTKSLNGL